MADTTRDESHSVARSVPRDAAGRSETFTAQAPFRVSDNTYIVGVVAGNYDSASQDQDGWLQSDFYALNYLLKGSGRSQTWLSSADPRVLLDKHGQYLHGNPRQERRVVLSHELLDTQKISLVEVHQTSKITDRFLEAVSQASSLAKANDGNLLILTFCHGNHGVEELGGRGPGKDVQRLYLGGSREGGLSVNQLKGAINQSVNTTLISSACYVGGWLVEPDFNYRAIMASGGPIAESCTWRDSKSIGRACGPAFASAVMDSLCRIQPKEPRQAEHPEAHEEAVTLIYNQLCRSVLELCGRTLFEGKDHFSFPVQNDDREESWPDNTGIPWKQFKSRWEALEIAQVAVEPEVDANVSEIVCATRSLQLKDKGKQASQYPPAASPAESPNPRLKLAVDRFLAITPRSTYTYGGPRIKGFLNGCARTGNPVEEIPEDEVSPISELMNAWHVMSFRTEFATLVTYLVDGVGLPRPFNKRALEFDDDAWWQTHHAKDASFFDQYKEFDKRVGSDIFHQLYSFGTVVQGGPFTAMVRYVKCSIYEYYRSDARLTIDDAAQKWRKFHDLLEEIGRGIVETAKRDEKLKEKSDRYRGMVGQA